MTELQFSYEKMGIDVEALCREMGYGDHVADASTLSAMRRVMSEASAVAMPRCCYVVLRGEVAHGVLTTNGVRLHIGTTIAGQLHGSEAFAFFVATAGCEYGAYQERLRCEGDLLRVFIADALGSLLAERSAEAMERAVQASIDKLGWHHTNRFSPGYCSWPLSDQQHLFSFLGGHPCGVQLTESSLMVPVKTVSGVVGLGPDVERLDYVCSLCGRKDCFLKGAEV